MAMVEGSNPPPPPPHPLEGVAPEKLTKAKILYSLFLGQILKSVIATDEFVNKVELAKIWCFQLIRIKCYQEKTFEEGHNETTWYWMG